MSRSHARRPASWGLRHEIDLQVRVLARDPIHLTPASATALSSIFKLEVRFLPFDLLSSFIPGAQVKEDGQDVRRF